MEKLEKVIFIAHKDNGKELIDILISNRYNFYYGTLDYSVLEHLGNDNHNYIAFHITKNRDGALDKRQIVWGSYKKAKDAIETEESRNNNATGFLLTDNNYFIKL